MDTKKMHDTGLLSDGEYIELLEREIAWGKKLNEDIRSSLTDIKALLEKKDDAIAKALNANVDLRKAHSKTIDNMRESLRNMDAIVKELRMVIKFTYIIKTKPFPYAVEWLNRQMMNFKFTRTQLTNSLAMAMSMESAQKYAQRVDDSMLVQERVLLEVRD